MNKIEYEVYRAAVEEFFQTEGINNLSLIMEGEDSEANEPFFSWHPCECCRRRQGGNRYHCNGYRPATGDIEEYYVCEDCYYFAEYGQLDDTTMYNLERGIE